MILCYAEKITTNILKIKIQQKNDDFHKPSFQKTNLKNGQNNVLTNKVSFGSATRTRTGVYGVRGRCPRPLDDSTKALSAVRIEHVLCVVPRKRVQKYCLFLICANIETIFLRFFLWLDFVCYLRKRNNALYYRALSVVRCISLT